jgi:hypothetical protein
MGWWEWFSQVPMTGFLCTEEQTKIGLGNPTKITYLQLIYFRTFYLLEN